MKRSGCHNTHLLEVPDVISSGHKYFWSQEQEVRSPLGHKYYT